MKNLDALHAELDRGARFDAEYGVKLANHLPMALTALHRLGADAARLASFSAAYARDAGLHAMPPAEPWPAGDPWPGRLGDPRAWPAYRHLFHQWLQYEGPSDVLTPVLPVLMRGCGAAAFHGLIRVAHAVDAAHANELADALAYWACRWFALPEAAGPARTDDPADAVAAWRRTSPGAKAEAPLIAERMALVGADPAFARAAGALRIETADDLPKLTRWAGETYAQTGDFTVLHLVTSAHALRVLWPFMDEDDRLPALRRYATAFVAGCASARPVARAESRLLPWPEIVRRALACDDEHVIKLVDSCQAHRAALGVGPWQRAATRAVAGLAG